jgi:hypothetical protein
MNKQIIIIDHNDGGRLANQLWLYINVYAYALEYNYKILNYSFFQYFNSFNIKQKSIIVFIINYSFYIIKKIFGKNNKDFYRRYKRVYNLFIRILTNNKIIIKADDIPYTKPDIVYLPPSKTNNKIIIDFQRNNNKNIYLKGWLFRNPVGLKKYHNNIQKYFSPNKKIQGNIDSTINELRKKYKKIIGVHVRQGDYKKKFWNGDYFVNEAEIKKIIFQYIKKFDINIDDTVFLFCSDEFVDMTIFSGINTVRSPFTDAVTDLFLLSKTDTIIGSNSTFGDLAAYFGDIPFIVFNNFSINWEYYKDKNKYFQNKYSSFVRF